MKNILVLSLLVLTAPAFGAGANTSLATCRMLSTNGLYPSRVFRQSSKCCVRILFPSHQEAKEFLGVLWEDSIQPAAYPLSTRPTPVTLCFDVT